MRRTLLLLVTPALAAALVALLASTLAVPRLSMERVERIRVGMTRAEVEGLCGRPAEVCMMHWPGNAYSNELPSETTYLWACDTAWLSVRFGPDGRAADVEIQPGGISPQPSFLERICAWLWW